MQLRVSLKSDRNNFIASNQADAAVAADNHDQRELYRIPKQLRSYKPKPSQALKNLSSEGGDGLEEGTVSALIAMSDGNSDNSVSNFDDSALAEPKLKPIKDMKFPLNETLKPAAHMDEFAPLTVTVIKEMGGDAPSGKGPAAPPPPTMASQHVPHKPVVDEEVDQKSEDDEQLSRVMLYAKMGVPHDLQNDDSIIEEDGFEESTEGPKVTEDLT